MRRRSELPRDVRIGTRSPDRSVARNSRRVSCRAVDCHTSYMRVRGGQDGVIAHRGDLRHRANRTVRCPRRGRASARIARVRLRAGCSAPPRPPIGGTVRARRAVDRTLVGGPPRAGCDRPGSPPAERCVVPAGFSDEALQFRLHCRRAKGRERAPRGSVMSSSCIGISWVEVASRSVRICQAERLEMTWRSRHVAVGGQELSATRRAGRSPSMRWPWSSRMCWSHRQAATVSAEAEQIAAQIT